MPKFRVYATVQGSKYLGEFEANGKDDAERMALESDECYVSLCHQCAEECENAEITEVVAEAVTENN